MNMRSECVDAAARRDAARMYRTLPAFNAATNARARGYVSGSVELSEIVRYQKPETYARFGRFIDLATNATLNQPVAGSPVGLYAGDDELRPAQLLDVVTWEGLALALQATLAHNVREVFRAAPSQRHAELVALRALWENRNRSIGAALRSPEEHTVIGGRTGAWMCVKYALAMHRRLLLSGKPLEQRVPTIIRSTGPISATSSLEMAQAAYFSESYLGEVNVVDLAARTVRIRHNLEAVRDDILVLGPNNRMGLDKRIEDYRTRYGLQIGSIHPALPGMRIGCPVPLIPKLLPRLWAWSVRSAVKAGLIR